MLTSKKKVRTHLRKAEYIIKTCVQGERLDIMNLCELGGHRQGLSAAGIYPNAMKISDGTPASVSVNKNNLTA